MRTFKIDITIDMLLDGKLVLVIEKKDRSLDYKFCWSEPNRLSRGDGNFNQQYFPVARDTTLHFEFPFYETCKVNVGLSYLELGYTGAVQQWVGPGRLFKYSLSRYIDQLTIPIIV